MLLNGDSYGRMVKLGIRAEVLAALAESDDLAELNAEAKEMLDAIKEYETELNLIVFKCNHCGKYHVKIDLD